MWIKYYLEGVKFAARRRDAVPRKDDLVRFYGQGYRVKTVVWVEDEKEGSVAISIEKT